MLEDGRGCKQYTKLLFDLRQNGSCLMQMCLTLTAKAWGYLAPYGSYWIALSLIMDGEDESIIQKLLMHVENWSHQHSLLKPRHLHLQAELAWRSDVSEVRVMVSFASDCKAVILFDRAIAEAEIQGLVSCAAFLNERFISRDKIVDNTRCGHLLKEKFGATSRTYTG